MPRRAKSIHLHLLEGNKNRKTKDEINQRLKAEEALNPGADKVKPPMWLSKQAKKEFKFLATQLKQIKLMTNNDIHMLAVYCDAYADYVKFTKIVDEEGPWTGFLSLDDDGNTIETDKQPHPMLVKKKHAFDQMAKVAAEFGFTPGSRAKIAIPKKEEKAKTPFEEKFGDV